MEPALPYGSLAVVQATDGGKVAPGDVITYRDHRGLLVTHRIVATAPGGEGFSELEPIQAWIDLVAFLPSVAMQGGPRPWEVFEAHPLGRDAPAEQVLPVVAALAGFFVERSLQPPPPGLPTLREFQRAQGIEALAWLRRSLGGS